MIHRLSAVVVAAGRSERFQRQLQDSTSASKIFIEWQGKPLIRHTVEALIALEPAEIVLVGQSECFESFERIFKDFQKTLRIFWVAGGARRQDSVRNGLNALAECERVLVHDGARPFLKADFLKVLDLASQTNEGVIPAAPVVETLKRVTKDGYISETVNRSEFFRAQTPQFFKFSLIRDLHNQLEENQKEFTDDAAILEFFGHRVKVVEGSAENIKVTVPEDLRSRGIHV